VTDNSNQAWLQQEDEDGEWFERFTRFYLPLGSGRNIIKAYTAYLLALDTKKYVEFISRPNRNATEEWSNAAREYDWRKRSIAWDAFHLIELTAQVDLARQKLQAATVKAVDTLITNLESDRYSVAAAKEILNRGGLPETSKHEVAISQYTADEFNAATREVEEWREKTTQTEKDPTDKNG